MRIGFAGAGGTGKTTLAKGISSMLSIPYQSSVARRVFERHSLTEKDLETRSLEDNLKLQLELFEEREKDEATWGPNAISDRTLLDQFCYLLMRTSPLVTKDMADGLGQRVLNSLHRFDLIVTFPLVTYAGADDGMRQLDFGRRLQFHLLISGSAISMNRILRISGANVEWVEAPLATFEQRYRWLENIIKRKGWVG